MKVTAANVYVVPAGNRRGVILEIETDAGITGIGEAGVGYGWGGEAAAAMIAQIMSTEVIGRDPGPVEAIWGELYDRGFWTKGGGAITTAALSAIDVALWDIKGKALGVPVHSLFGGPFRERLKVYANGWWMGCETGREFAEAGKRIVGTGVGGLKFYPLGLLDKETVIRHPTYRQVSRTVLDLAVERVECLREAVGTDVDILLDLGGGLTIDQLRPLLRRLEPFDVGFIEEPVDPAIPEAMQQLNTAIPIAAGERAYTRYAFNRLLRTGSVDILQPDVGNCGGLSEARRIAAMAECHNVSIAPHNYGSTLATVIAAQFAASIPNFRVLEFFPEFDREPGYVDLIDAPIETAPIEDGMVRVPQGAGLGVSLRPEHVEEHLWRRVGADD